MTARLLHYSATAIRVVTSRDQRDGRARDWGDKPNGLWVSVEGEHDWRWWCEAEAFGEPSKQLCYEVTLAPSAKIFRITTEAALREFSHDYGIVAVTSRPVQRRARMQDAPPDAYVGSIVWDHLGATYDGIIIAPYQWACRHDPATAWYYGWDCASGCIWNARAVARLTLVGPSAQRQFA